MAQWTTSWHGACKLCSPPCGWSRGLLFLLRTLATWICSNSLGFHMKLWIYVYIYIELWCLFAIFSLAVHSGSPQLVGFSGWSLAAGGTMALYAAIAFGRRTSGSGDVVRRCMRCSNLSGLWMFFYFVDVTSTKACQMCPVSFYVSIMKNLLLETCTD